MPIGKTEAQQDTEAFPRWGSLIELQEYVEYIERTWTPQQQSLALIVEFRNRQIFGRFPAEIRDYLKAKILALEAIVFPKTPLPTGFNLESDQKLVLNGQREVPQTPDEGDRELAHELQVLTAEAIQKLYADTAETDLTTPVIAEMLARAQAWATQVLETTTTAPQDLSDFS